MGTTNATKPTRNVKMTDKPGTPVTNRTGEYRGILIAVYDHFAWVLWDGSWELKGCWQPDTEKRTDVFVV